jgi:RNA polymerase sigma-54 factor
MKTALQFKLSQQLALTPQLQQSIRLLQLSTLELNQEIEQMLAENPLLERDDDPLGECVSISANGTLDPPLPQGLADLGGTPAETAQRNDDGDRESVNDSEGSNPDGDDAPADWGHDSANTRSWRAPASRWLSTCASSSPPPASSAATAR